MEAIRSAGSATSAAARAHAAPDEPVHAIEQLVAGRAQQLPGPAALPAAPARLRRGLTHLNPALQGDVASAQQALDYLEQVASQLQALKSELSAKLSGRKDGQHQIDALLRQLGNAMNRRQDAAGSNLDAQLVFNNEAPAVQRFRIRGLQLDQLQAGPDQVLSFTLGATSQTLPVSLTTGLSHQEIVQRFDRALAPAKVRVSADAAGALVFSTPEPAWPGVRDSLALQGRGRVAIDEQAGILAPQRWVGEDIAALRQSLHEVVQALAQVRRSQDAASRALAAAGRAAALPLPGADMAALAQHFAATAITPNYDSLLAITSALAGISRERVLSLLGLR